MSKRASRADARELEEYHQMSQSTGNNDSPPESGCAKFFHGLGDCCLGCLCCCPRSLQGVWRMLKQDSIRDFALAVVIGNSFEELINAFSANLAMPGLWALMTPDADAPPYCVNSCAGIVFETDSSGNEYHSIADARVHGAHVLELELFLEALLTFVLALLSTFWFFSLLNKPKEWDENERETSGAALLAATHVDETKPGYDSGNGAMTVAAVLDDAQTVKEAMQRLHSHSPELFYMHGEQIRKMVEYRLKTMTPD